jgi:hypothetical protein
LLRRLNRHARRASRCWGTKTGVRSRILGVRKNLVCSQGRGCWKRQPYFFGKSFSPQRSQRKAAKGAKKRSQLRKNLGKSGASPDEKQVLRCVPDDIVTGVLARPAANSGVASHFSHPLRDSSGMGWIFPSQSHGTRLNGHPGEKLLTRKGRKEEPPRTQRKVPSGESPLANVPR